VKRLIVGFVLIAFCTLPSTVTAFTLSGVKWPQPSTTFRVDIPGFDAAFADAVNRWNTATPYFQFSVVNSSFDPCSNPNITSPGNGAKFDTTDCGTAWGASTLAVTTTWASNGVIVQSGIVFNSTKTWSIYSGPYQTGSNVGIQDFTRVAVHELGHTMGLAHENSAPSIMAAVIAVGSTIEVPQQDDKEAVQALYGTTPDTTPPVLAITSPTSSGTFSTGSNTITLGGTGSDNVGVTVVNWTNSRGGSGPCSFTGTAAINWTCSGISLQLGQNILTVTGGDASANRGTTTITVTQSPVVPVISAVGSAPGVPATAIVTWLTDQPADSQVEFGPTQAYGQSTVLNSSPTTSHSINLTGLSLNTTYHYRVKSQGLFTGLGTSGDFTFTTFSVSNMGGMSRTTDGSAPALTTGFTRIQPGNGSTTPSGIAIFSYKPQGTLIGETTITDSPALSSGRTYAEIRNGGVVNTGFAFVNPNTTSVRVSFDLRDKAGNIVSSGFRDLAPGQHVARFLDQDPFLGGSSFQGTFSFTASSPVSAIAVRGFNNERTPTDFLMSSLPMIDLSAAVRTGPQIIPQFAVGSGCTTRIFLVNPTGQTQTGSFEFRDSAGALASVIIDGTPGTGAPYSLLANGAAEFVITGNPTSLASGSVHVLPTGGGPVPTPLVLFSYKPGDITVTEATVPVTMGSAFRMYVELSPASLINSGIAIANAGDSPGTVTLSVTRLDGLSVVSTTLNLGAAGQIVGFLDGMIPALAGQNLQGILRIASDVSISVVGLRARYNDRSPEPDFLMATTSPTLETALPGSAERFFPQIVNGAGFTTQVILFSGTAGQNSAGDLTFFQTETGSPLNLDLR